MGKHTLSIVKATNFIRPSIEGVPICATNGTDTLESSGFFTGGVFREAFPRIVKRSIPTEEIFSDIWLAEDKGVFSKIFSVFGSAGEIEYEESQVSWFCCHHRDKLGFTGHGTFLRMQGGLVAHILADCKKRYAHVLEFTCGFEWRANKYYVVVPQPKP